MNRVLFSSISDEWRTPESLYKQLDAEFHFSYDPCPLGGVGGLLVEWGVSNFVNPPYSNILNFVEKAVLEWRKGKVVVLLVPSRTDTVWFHRFVLPFASEIRFIKGRLRFNNSKNSAPFPSMVVIYR